MSDWVVALEGTAAGEQVALILALIAAMLHAVFGALQKGQHDPWLSRGAIDFSLVVISAPVALFLVPWPEGQIWLLLLGAMGIHFAYKLGQALAYSRGAYTVVYPVVRGTGPLFTVFGAWIIFGEHFAPLQWVGVAVLVSGILGLAVYNMRNIETGRDTLVPALWLAVGTGALVALYTTYDAYGIRATPNPFTFLMWFFFLSSLDFPILAALRWKNMTYRPALKPLFLKGLIGAFVAWGSFGAVMLATRLGKVGEAAVMRETSPVFAALIGWLILREPVGPRRVALIGLIAAGAVIVEVAG
ncbi:DMT family transporter [uncultured Shimia sp.]|uniref:DMT family transporter n=1 Tax=uncultured Shimia sp. TaxID=573152 RepID=UPI0026026288|nr:DMT family transporter [uncultured Shimia sp.]